MAWPARLTPLSVSAAGGARVLVVLVVEDEFFVRYDLANCLREAGHRVVESANGEQAIALCRSPAAIDMVFTDINLGGSASGFDVAECFRRERPDIPVLYLSGERIDWRGACLAACSSPSRFGTEISWVRFTGYAGCECFRRSELANSEVPHSREIPRHVRTGNELCAAMLLNETGCGVP